MNSFSIFVKTTVRMNHRRTLHFILFVAIAAFALACGKKEGHEHDDSDATTASADEWKAMDDFHVIMAETFHPFKDSSNLEPAKTHSEHLAMEAEKWAGATLPEKVNNEETKTKLEKLKTDTRAFADKVKAGGTDEEVGAQLTAIHDLFHEIQESWYTKEHH